MPIRRLWYFSRKPPNDVQKTKKEQSNKCKTEIPNCLNSYCVIPKRSNCELKPPIPRISTIASFFSVIFYEIVYLLAFLTLQSALYFMTLFWRRALSFSCPSGSSVVLPQEKLPLRLCLPYLQKKKIIFPQEPRLNFCFASYFWQRLLFLLRRLLSYCLCLSVFLFLKTLVCITRVSFLCVCFCSLHPRPSLSPYGFHLSQNSDRIPSFAPGIFSCGAISEAFLSLRNSY